MPKRSRRLRTLEDIAQAAVFCMASGEYSLADDLIIVGREIEKKRYLYRRKSYLPRHSHYFSPEGKFYNMTDIAFKEKFRCTRMAFKEIVREVASTEIFKKRNRGRHAADPEWKVAVALWRFSVYGNAARIVAVAAEFEKSVGTIFKWTADVVFSLYELRLKWIKWPSRTERKAIRKAVAKNVGVEEIGVVGFLDGVHIRISDRPSKQHEVYYNRKQFYSLNVQLVVDHTRRIIGYNVGPPGSVTDSKSWKETLYHREPEKYFSKNEYLCTDAGYAKSNVLQPKLEVNDLGRAGLADGFTAQEIKRVVEQMNGVLSEARVVSEHANGILKSRWQSLRGLRMQFKTEKECDFAFNWVIACMVLHNMLTDFRDSFLEKWGEWDKKADDLEEQVRPTADDEQLASTDYAKALRIDFVQKVAEILKKKSQQ